MERDSAVEITQPPLGTAEHASVEGSRGAVAVGGGLLRAPLDEFIKLVEAITTAELGRAIPHDATLGGMARSGTKGRTRTVGAKQLPLKGFGEPARDIEEAVARYSAAARKKLANPVVQGQPEDQLRSPIDGLVRDLAGLCKPAWRDQTVLVGEAPIQELKCRPDFAVVRNGLLSGHIELKAPGKGADPRRFRGHDKDQWERLRSLPNLVYTDGSEFSLWRSGELVEEIITLGDLTDSRQTLAAPSALVRIFELFFHWTPASPKNAKELADVTARLCRLLRDEVLEQLSVGSPGLKLLETTWKKTLFPDASDEQFADGYAQAVTFGMLLARAQDISLVDLSKTAQELSNTLIGAALRVLTFTNSRSQPVTSLILLKRVLDVIDWQRISRGDPDAWLYFYEDFLTSMKTSWRSMTQVCESRQALTTPRQKSSVRWCDSSMMSFARVLVCRRASVPTK